MSQHTPGPWTVLKKGKYGAHSDHPAVIKDEGDGVPWCVIAARVNGPDVHQARANARLISAAPELLALLEVFVRQLDDGDLADAAALGLDAHVVDARALLARIEGQGVRA